VADACFIFVRGGRIHSSLCLCAYVCVCFDRALLLACSLRNNKLGVVGGQAVAQALKHTPNLVYLE
jgi:hypothetical protein